MAGVSDYITEIQKYAPYFNPNQGNVMNELNRRAGEGATVDQVVNDALGPGGYAENQLSAQNYLKPQYDAQFAGLDTQAQQAQNQANYASGQANNASSRLMQAVARTYQGVRENDPLARQGIVSSAAQNSNANNEAQQYGNINTDLQSQLHDIASSLGAATSGIAAQRSALQGQQAHDVTGLVTNARNAINVAQQTPYGQSVDVGGTTVFGKNPASITNLFSNPGFLNLLSSAGNNATVRPILSTLLAPYGINVVDDIGLGGSGSPSSTGSSTTSNNTSSGNTVTSDPGLLSAIQRAQQSGNYTQGSLIQALANHTGAKAGTPDYQNIVNAVLKNFPNRSRSAPVGPVQP